LGGRGSSQDERQAAMARLAAFLSRGGSVCPFAVRVRRIYATAGTEPRFDRVLLRRTVEDFAETRGKTPNGALLVLRRVETTHRRFRL